MKKLVNIGLIAVNTAILLIGCAINDKVVIINEGEST